MTYTVMITAPDLDPKGIALLDKLGAKTIIAPAYSTEEEMAKLAADNQVDGIIVRVGQVTKQVIDAFLPFDYVVTPSGSCAGMIKAHYSEIFADNPDWALKQEELAAKTYELTQFLHDVMDWRPAGVTLAGSAADPDSCTGLRGLVVKEQPRALLAEIAGLELRPLPGAAACCAFARTFCVNDPDISSALIAAKAHPSHGTAPACSHGWAGYSSSTAWNCRRPRSRPWANGLKTCSSSPMPSSGRCRTKRSVPPSRMPSKCSLTLNSRTTSAP